MFFEPLVHAGVVDNDDIGMGKALDFLLCRELAPAECAQVVDESDGFGSLPPCDAALDDIELFEGVLNEQHVALMELEQQIEGAEELAEVGADLAFPGGDGEVAEVHLLHEFVDVTFRRIGRIYADVTIHLFEV